MYIIVFQSFWRHTRCFKRNSFHIYIFLISDKKKTLNPKCQQYLDSATSLLQSTLQNMWTGQIHVKEIMLIAETKDTFFNVSNIIWQCDYNKNLDKKLFLCFLERRKKEIDTALKAVYILEEFIDHCQYFNGNVLMV